MTYDDGRYQTRQSFGPIFGSFANQIGTVTTKVQTSVNTTDRAEFFRNIKVVDFKWLHKTETGQGGSAADYTYSIRLMAGTDIIATAPLDGTAQAGVMIDGVVVSSNASKIAADEALSLAWRITPNGTAHTSTTISGEAWIAYQERFTA